MKADSGTSLAGEILFFFALTFFFIMIGTGCKSSPNLDDKSSVADVSIKELTDKTYTTYQFAMEQQGGSGFTVPRTTFKKAATQAILARVPVGTYKITLEYYQDKTLVFSSALCKDADRNDVQKLVAGANSIALNVCNPLAQPQTPPTSDVSVDPVFKDNNKPVATTTFTLKDGRLLDPAGKLFTFRGVNIPFAYYFDQSFTALDYTKSMGFNTVRIVWCADTFADAGGRCQPKDLRPAADLDRVLTRIADQRMVAIFSLQNATGDDTLNALQMMANYLMKDDIKAVLVKHKKNVIINIANEWLGSWNKTTAWVDGYRTVVPQLRKAGLDHVLIADARGYGQDFSSLQESAVQLMAVDKNLMFASHMYAEYGTDQKVLDAMTFIRTRRIPYLIGEFGCSHYDDGSRVNKPVACDAIIREAANAAFPIGTMAWSYAGNRTEEKDLDVFGADWRTLTAYGKKVVDGVKATSKQACVFDMTLCP